MCLPINHGCEIIYKNDVKITAPCGDVILYVPGMLPLDKKHSSEDIAAAMGTLASSLGLTRKGWMMKITTRRFINGKEDHLNETQMVIESK